MHLPTLLSTLTLLLLSPLTLASPTSPTSPFPTISFPNGPRPSPNAQGRIRCGGHVAPPYQYNCEAPEEVCIDDPFVRGCGMACDRPGMCTTRKNVMCGGFAGFRCKVPGARCVDDPGDDCDPKNGGADCSGICVEPPTGWREGQVEEE